VWEGRFKSSLIQAEDYLLTCYRDIELNPVRADRVRDPGEYAWLSYRHNGLGQVDVGREIVGAKTVVLSDFQQQ